MFKIEIPKCEKTTSLSRRIEKRSLITFPDYGDEQLLFKIDADLFVEHCKEIKPTLLKTRMKRHTRVTVSGWSTSTEYHARFSINTGAVLVSHPYDNSKHLRLKIFNLGLSADFQIDIQFLIKILRTFKKERIALTITEKQLIIRHDRNRVAINFVGVKDV